jgi:hypothetical protein
VKRRQEHKGNHALLNWSDTKRARNFFSNPDLSAAATRTLQSSLQVCNNHDTRSRVHQKAKLSRQQQLTSFMLTPLTHMQNQSESGKIALPRLEYNEMKNGQHTCYKLLYLQKEGLHSRCCGKRSKWMVLCGLAHHH